MRRRTEGPRIAGEMGVLSADTLGSSFPFPFPFPSPSPMIGAWRNCRPLDFARDDRESG